MNFLAKYNVVTISSGSPQIMHGIHSLVWSIKKQESIISASPKLVVGSHCSNEKLKQKCVSIAVR